MNKKWKNNLRLNPKCLWDMIDWNDSRKEAEVPRIDPSIIEKYFVDIFQSKCTTNNPVVEDILDIVNRYHCYVPLLDDQFSINEFNDAINEIGKGTGVDGIDPKIAHLFPMRLRVQILNFLNVVFENHYPSNWEKHLLFPILKKGHNL